VTLLLPPLGGYQRCGKPDCLRKVKPGVAFCCEPCGIAADGRYEIHDHSAWCDERAAERGEFTRDEAQRLPSPPAYTPLLPVAHTHPEETR
jgi:hypothetical protein